MADDTNAEDIAMALGLALVRKGLLDSNDLERAATDAERDGRGDAAHALRLIAIEATAPEASDWTARRLRGQMRLVADGGNSGTD